MKKGQASTEYLIVVAVVLIIALVVVGVMGWFPGLGGEVKQTESKQYWESMAFPFAIKDYKLAGTALTLSLQNMVQDKLTLTEIYVDGIALSAADVTFSGGQRKTVSATLGSSCGGSGESFTYSLVFQYDNVDSGITANNQTGGKDFIGKCT